MSMSGALWLLPLVLSVALADQLTNPDYLTVGDGITSLPGSIQAEDANTFYDQTTSPNGDIKWNKDLDVYLEGGSGSGQV